MHRRKDKARACESLGFVVNKSENFLKDKDFNKKLCSQRKRVHHGLMTHPLFFSLE